MIDGALPQTASAEGGRDVLGRVWLRHDLGS